MSQIDRLTDEQQALLAQYRDRGIEIGFCTDPADRPRAEAAIAEMYRQAGLAPPVRIVWCGSPLSLAMTCSIIHTKDLMGDIGNTVRDPIGRHGWQGRVPIITVIKNRIFANAMDNIVTCISNGALDAVSRTVRGGIIDIEGTIEEGVWDDLHTNIGIGIWKTVEASIKDSVGDIIDDHIWKSIEDFIRNGIETDARNLRDSAYLSLRTNAVGELSATLTCYRYFLDILGLTSLTLKLNGLWELTQSAGWAIPCKRICWVSERPTVMAHDDQGRLHSLTGPACSYPDGWAIYAIHGVRVPAFVIDEPSKITVMTITAADNTEVRRVMIDRYRHDEEVSGPAAYLRDAGATRLNHDERYGTLWRQDMVDDEPIVMIEVTNSTPEDDGRFRHYWLRVPPQMTTAREAVAWTFNIRPEDYEPHIET